jgi:hypothetical protein
LPDYGDALLDFTRLILKVSLCDINFNRLIDASGGPVLFGTTVYQCSHLYDDNGVTGEFFNIDQLSIRRAGKYILRFDMFKLTSLLVGESNKGSSIASIFSDVITAYHPQKFPGVQGDSIN